MFQSVSSQVFLWFEAIREGNKLGKEKIRVHAAKGDGKGPKTTKWNAKDTAWVNLIVLELISESR